jgi:hypothetical protein
MSLVGSGIFAWRKSQGPARGGPYLVTAERGLVRASAEV